MAQADAPTRERLRAIIEQGDSDGLPEALSAIHACGSLDYSRARAGMYARVAGQALDGLPDTAAVAALRGLANYAINRDH